MISFNKKFILILNLLITGKIYNQQIHLIGSSKTGFFSNFFQVLNHIAFAQRNGKIPAVDWSSNSLYFQIKGYNNSTNPWEYYFEQLTNLPYKNQKIFLDYFAPDGSGIEYQNNNGLGMLKYKKWANNLIKKYIRIKPNIYNKTLDFFKKNIVGKPTIGIHLRGTDKNLEVSMIDPLLIISKANEYNGYQYFVATDEERLLELAKKNLKGKVISYNSVRSTDGNPIHSRYDKNIALRGEEVLIEVLLLASCNKLIHTISNVSIAAYFFNPDLPGIIFTPNKKIIYSHK